MKRSTGFVHDLTIIGPVIPNVATQLRVSCYIRTHLSLSITSTHPIEAINKNMNTAHLHAL